MKVLERTFRKSERLVAKARFTYVVFLRELLIAAILGGIIAVLWIYRQDINGLLGQEILTEQILYYTIAGCAGLVLLLCIFEGISKWQKEAVITDRKFVVRTGIINTIDVQLPLNQIKSVKVEQNLFQRLFGYGKVVIVVDAVSPVEIKGIVSPTRFAQCITKQKSRYEYESGSKNFNLILAKPTQSR